MKHPDMIFSGDYSVEMWNKINGAKTKDDLKWALYFVCCKLQELESKFSKQQMRKGERHGKVR